MSIRLPKAADDDPPVGQGFAANVSRTWTDPQTGEIVTWDERALVLRSAKLARREQRGLADRLRWANFSQSFWANAKSARRVKLLSQRS
jgi:hypothetical protein